MKLIPQVCDRCRRCVKVMVAIGKAYVGNRSANKKIVFVIAVLNNDNAPFHFNVLSND